MKAFRNFKTVLVSILTISTLAITGCGGTTPPSNPNPTPAPRVAAGTLVFDIPIPSGATNFKANVQISGAAGFSQTVTGSGSVDLAPGSYTLTVGDGRSSGFAADTLYQATLEGPGGNPRNITVSDGSSTAFTVSHQARVASGKVWVTHSKVLHAYSDAVLGGNAGNQNPSDSLGFFSDFEFQGMAVDASGNLWLNSETALGKFSPDLKLLGVASFPQDAPNGSETILARSMAFDKNGVLWVVDGSNNQRVLGYTPIDLAKIKPFDPKTAAPILEPTHRINLPFNPFTTAAVFLSGLAFDAAGNMWLSDAGANGNGHLFRLDAASKAINLTIPATRPLFMAFDLRGNLWVSGEGISRFDAPLASTSTPSLLLKNANGGIAFDNRGNLWAAASGGLLEFDAPQIASSGIQTLTPARTIPGIARGSSLVFVPSF